MEAVCPCCKSSFAVTITLEPIRLEPAPMPEEWLAPCQLADRLGLCESHIRKMINRGLQNGRTDCERRGGRLAATVNAIQNLRHGG